MRRRLAAAVGKDKRAVYLCSEDDGGGGEGHLRIINQVPMIVVRHYRTVRLSSDSAAIAQVWSQRWAGCG